MAREGRTAQDGTKLAGNEWYGRITNALFMVNKELSGLAAVHLFKASPTFGNERTELKGSSLIRDVWLVDAGRAEIEHTVSLLSALPNLRQLFINRVITIFVEDGRPRTIWNALLTAGPRTTSLVLHHVPPRTAAALLLLFSHLKSLELKFSQSCFAARSPSPKDWSISLSTFRRHRAREASRGSGLGVRERVNPAFARSASKSPFSSKPIWRSSTAGASWKRSASVPDS